MHSLTVLIKSNHEDGDLIENQLQFIYDDETAFTSPINLVEDRIRTGDLL